MQENNDIILAGGDALVYLAEPIHKKYSTTFVWSHPNEWPVFWPAPPRFPQLRTYLMDGLFFNQNTNKHIRISYSLKFKHSKKTLSMKK